MSLLLLLLLAVVLGLIRILAADRRYRGARPTRRSYLPVVGEEEDE